VTAVHYEFDRKKRIEPENDVWYSQPGSMTSEREYVLGTNDEEIARLGLQHRAWKARSLDAWRLAEIGSGHTVLDVGCGPGYASLDLAELVGPSGRVVAIDQSARFLEALGRMCHERGVENVTAYRADLEAGEFVSVLADRMWCRWVLSFVKSPRDVLARMAAALCPGGALVLHEYFDYSTWRTAPRCPEVEEFVDAAMASWRDAGGEPDIGIALPPWIEELGLEIRQVRPIIDIVTTDQASWAWLRAFIDVGRRRLIEMGYLSESRSTAIWRAFTEFEATPRARMITPAVLEIVAVPSGRAPLPLATAQ
jgi:SAM-dependent methyltransferase